MGFLIDKVVNKPTESSITSLITVEGLFSQWVPSSCSSTSSMSSREPLNFTPLTGDCLTPETGKRKLPTTVIHQVPTKSNMKCLMLLILYW